MQRVLDYAASDSLGHDSLTSTAWAHHVWLGISSRGGLGRLCEGKMESTSACTIVRSPHKQKALQLNTKPHGRTSSDEDTVNMPYAATPMTPKAMPVLRSQLGGVVFHHPPAGDHTCFG